MGCLRLLELDDQHGLVRESGRLLIVIDVPEVVGQRRT